MFCQGRDIWLRYFTIGVDSFHIIKDKIVMDEIQNHSLKTTSPVTIKAFFYFSVILVTTKKVEKF
jgi:hypothetical protein